MSLSSNVPLVLASASSYRRELLQRLGVSFSQAEPAYDEDAHRHHFEAEGDDEFALRLAIGKAESLADRFAQHWILAADQVAALPEPRELLNKPGTERAAVEQLMRMSGKTHSLTTAVVMLDARSGARTTAIDRQTMVMRSFDRPEAEAYVNKFRPLDCAGSYRIEDGGIRLFERIDSHDYTGIIGLPLLAVARLLRGAGLL